MVDEDKGTEARSDGQAIGTDPLRVLWVIGRRLGFETRLQDGGVVTICPRVGTAMSYTDESGALAWAIDSLRDEAHARRKRASSLVKSASELEEMAELLDRYPEGGAS